MPDQEGGVSGSMQGRVGVRPSQRFGRGQEGIGGGGLSHGTHFMEGKAGVSALRGVWRLVGGCLRTRDAGQRIQTI